MIGIVRLIINYVACLITGEPYFIVFMRPEKRKVYSDTTGMSEQMVHDGVHHTLSYLLDMNKLEVRLTKREKELIEEEKEKLTSIY